VLILASQAAIAIENSLLVEGLEQRVKKRTFELERQTIELRQTNEELEQTSSKLKMAYSDLSQSEQNYRFLAENSHDVVIAFDSELQITYMSPAIEKLTGFTVEESIRQQIKMVHPDDFTQMMKLFNKTISSKGDDRILRYRRKLKKGGYLWVEIAASFIYDSKDKLFSMIMNVRDISAQMQAEKELKTIQDRLIQTEKMASLGILAAGIGHEINNPLNFIKGGIIGLEKQLIKSNNGNNEDSKHLLTIIDEGVERASRIVKSLGHFSRQGTEMDTKCDVNSIIENCLVILENKLVKIELIKKYSDRPVYVLGNEGRLHQAFMNILTNAQQAVQDVGTITIETKAVINTVEIRFTDTGLGIPEENLKLIHDPFFTTKSPSEGTGLGLSITHSIVQEHNGSLEVISSLGKGSSFIMRLPKFKKND
jgi:PAS domain S-box-containing protein